MTRILIDTSVYVDWFRSRRHEEIIAGRRGPPALSAANRADFTRISAVEPFELEIVT